MPKVNEAFGFPLVQETTGNDKKTAKLAVRVWAIKGFTPLASEFSLAVRTFLFWDAGENSPLIEELKKRPKNLSGERILQESDFQDLSDDVKACVPALEIIGEKVNIAREVHTKGPDGSTMVMLTVMNHSMVVLPVMNLTTFPCNEGSINFTVWMPKAGDKANFEIVLDENLIDKNDNVKPIADGGKGIFEIKLPAVSHLCEQHNITGVDTSVYKDGSSATFELKTMRKPTFWVVKFGVPQCIVSTLTLTSWGVPVEDFADRTSITLTCLLMLFAISIVTSAELPKTAQHTYMDTYHLVSTKQPLCRSRGHYLGPTQCTVRAVSLRSPVLT